MSVLELLTMLSVGIIAGWLASHIIQDGGLGLVGNVVVGFIGSVLGTFIGNIVNSTVQLDLSSFASAALWSSLGAILLLYMMNAARRS